eukprot:gnl/TRDRNA2_/TRDRNA2_189556_c0_seq1.p1 gnl/TRDRNA2_/TRDRNA2_189556_c0~~gnl/TRDRNA2_/TRDRNA2_189556_c0_seq1.p1  ORF type:complete len:346 (+),score=31.09 gnl/TRDRNA2_/TRDRNA2_189556_c0_seq1:102-1139(+)
MIRLLTLFAGACCGLRLHQLNEAPALFDNHTNGCSVWPWECGKDDDAGTGSDAILKLQEMPSETRRQPLSAFVCPESIDPDLESLQQRIPKGPVSAPQNMTGTRLFQDMRGRSDPVYLFILMAPDTGSTAMLSLLATSPALSTLCSAGTPHCEGTWLLIRDGLIASEHARWDRNQPYDWNAAIQDYSRFWDLSKPVLADKSPPNIRKARRIYDDLTATGKNAKFIMVTRSLCYGSPPTDWQRDMMVRQKRRLPQDSLLHIRFEDLLRNPYQTAERVLAFLPQLKSIDPSKVGLTRSFPNSALSVTEYVLKRKRFPNHHAGEQVPESWFNYMKEFNHSMLGYHQLL